MNGAFAVESTQGSRSRWTLLGMPVIRDRQAFTGCILGRVRHLDVLLIAALAIASPAGSMPAASSAACTCMSPKRPVCEVWWQTSAIFVGRVTRVRTVQDDAAEGHRVRKVATVRVAENLEGLPRREREVEVRTGSGGGDCGFNFEADRSYLIYAARSAISGQLETGICSRTAPVEEAEADLAYLRGRQEAPQVVSLYGLVYRDRQTAEFGRDTEQPLDPGGPLAGLEVVLHGEGVDLTTITDEEGWYEYEGLAVGAYELGLRGPGIAETHRWGLRLPRAPACLWHDIALPPLPLESNAATNSSSAGH